MKRSEWLVRIALVFVLLYGVVAISDRPHEKFPFFAWDLFSTVPSPHVINYSARLISAGGYQKPFPVYYEQSGLQDPGDEIRGFSALQTLGKSIRSGNKQRSASLRTAFEATYLKGLSNVHYEIVQRSYDIRARVSCPTCFTRETVIATYTTR